MDRKILIPASAADITPQWVAQVMDKPVSEKGFEVEGDIQAGIGYLSSMCRVKFAFKEEGDHDYHYQQIVVKLQPTNSHYEDLAVCKGIKEREVLFYTKVASDLVAAVPTIAVHFCKCYHGSLSEDSTSAGDGASLIVMEDLKASGFRMVGKGDVACDVVSSVLSCAAKLHFGGHAVQIENGTSLPELYPPLVRFPEQEDWYNLFCTEANRPESYKKMGEYLIKCGLPLELRKKFLELEPLTPKLVKLLGKEANRFPCLIHGDLWLNNVLQHDTEAATIPAKVVDWQLLGYSDATFDLVFLLLTALPIAELTKPGLSRWIRFYFDEFETLCEQRGEEFNAKVKRRSWEEFEQFFFTWSMVFIYLTFMPFLDIFVDQTEKFGKVYEFLAEDLRLPEFMRNV